MTYQALCRHEQCPHWKEKNPHNYLEIKCEYAGVATRDGKCIGPIEPK